MPYVGLLLSAKGWLSLWGLVVVGQSWSSWGQSICSTLWNLGNCRLLLGFWVVTSLQFLAISLGSSGGGLFPQLLQGIQFHPFQIGIFLVWDRGHVLPVCLAFNGCILYGRWYVVPLFHGGVWLYGLQCCPCILTWWTIGTLLLTNLFTIYIHFSHTLAGVIITSPTLLYFTSNPLQPHSIACTSFQIITRLLTLICQQFLWHYSCWNMSPLPKHSLIVAYI